MKTTETKPVLIVKEFNKCIRNRDIFGLSRLMTKDHTYIDFTNNKARGKQDALVAWEKFFDKYHQYNNVFEEITAKDNLVIITGHYVSSHKAFNGRAIWAANVKGDKVAKWHSYEDTEQNREKLEINKK